MEKEEFVRRYGKTAYEMNVYKARMWARLHPIAAGISRECKNLNRRAGGRDHYKRVVYDRERYMKGGLHYAKTQLRKRTGLEGKKKRD